MNPVWNFPAHRTLSCPLASAACHHAATAAPVACYLVNPQPFFEPMINQKELVMTQLGSTNHLVQEMGYSLGSHI